MLSTGARPRPGGQDEHELSPHSAGTCEPGMYDRASRN